MSPRNLHTAAERLPVIPASRSHRDDNRENADDAESLVKPVHPIPVLPTDTGRGKHGDYHQAAPPKSILAGAYQPAKPGQEQSAKEGVHQPDQSHVLLFPVQSPSAHDVAGRCGKAAVYREARRYRHEDSQCRLAELADEQGVQYVADVFRSKATMPARSAVHFHPSPASHFSGRGSNVQPSSMTSSTAPADTPSIAG